MGLQPARLTSLDTTIAIIILAAGAGSTSRDDAEPEQAVG
jgi:hypothetical protein